jgi:hypothetical protein
MAANLRGGLGAVNRFSELEHIFAGIDSKGGMRHTLAL